MHSSLTMRPERARAAVRRTAIVAATATLLLGALVPTVAAADGEVGDRDPVAAVRDAIRGREIDEVVLSTLPPGISRWLGQDIPSKLRHNVSVPVDVVYEAAPAVAGG